MRNYTRPMLYRIKSIHDMIGAGRYPNFRDFHERFEVSRSTILRDLGILKVDFHAPIVFDGRKQGYCYSEPYELPFNSLDKDSSGILLRAMKALEAYKGTPFYDDLSESLGSMVSARWPRLLLPGIVTAVGLLFFLTQLRTLNTLLLGDEAAITLGVDLSKRRRIYMILTSLLSAIAVCTCGIVGFVGLMIPHIVRGFAGSDHRFLLPLAALSGGIFLVWADVVARILIPNTEIPLGVITSAIGAPIFVYMMVRRSYGFGGKD